MFHLIKSKLLAIACLASYSTMLYAQNQTKEHITLSISPNQETVVFAVRTNNNAALVCNFGTGEGIKSFDMGNKEGMTEIKYTFAHPSTAERQITIEADKLLTLRIVQKKQINGVVDLRSAMIKHLNIDYVDLTTHNKIDASQCPNLETLTLTFTGIEEIVLPQSDKLRSVQTSPTIDGKGTLKKLNNEVAPNLTQLGIVGASIDTLDVRNNLLLEDLIFSTPKKVMRGIKGAKKLKYLKSLDLRGNALAFDQLPNRTLVDEPVENFRYSMQSTYLIPKRCISGMTIDLSHLQYAQGISSGIETTQFTWKYKPSKDAKYVNVPLDKMEAKNGIFTFDKSLSKDDTLRVYCSMSNPGYPGIGKKGSNNIGTYMVKLTEGNSTGINRTHQQKEEFNIISTEQGIIINAPSQQQISVYNTNGSILWKGYTPAKIELKKGIYLVKAYNGKTKKIVR